MNLISFGQSKNTDSRVVEVQKMPTVHSLFQLIHGFFLSFFFLILFPKPWFQNPVEFKGNTRQKPMGNHPPIVRYEGFTV